MPESMASGVTLDVTTLVVQFLNILVFILVLIAVPAAAVYVVLLLRRIARNLERRQ